MQYFVFFDLDERIINCKSMIEVVNYYYQRVLSTEAGADKAFKKFMNGLSAFEKKEGVQRSDLNKYFYQQFKGLCADQMAIYCEQWFEMHGKELLDNKMVREIKFHQEQGAKVVIVSGSFEQCVSPIAAHLNVDRYICSQLETKNERFTGKLLNGPVIGEGKAKAIRQHLSDEANVDLNMSFAYGDDVSDIPMLSLVKNPVVIGKNEALIQYANENNWSLFC